jgi:hypothetical protein
MWELKRRLGVDAGIAREVGPCCIGRVGLDAAEAVSKLKITRF